MTNKELKELYSGLNDRLLLLETAIVNHTGQHRLKDIVQYINAGLLIVVILLLKFKIL